MEQSAESITREVAATARKNAQRVAQAASEAGDTAAAAVDQGVAQGADAIEAGAAYMTEHTQAVAERTAAAMEAAAEQGRALSQDLQAVTEAWAASARQTAERTLDRLNILSQARYPTDFIGAQRDLIWGGVEDALAAQQRIAEASIALMTNAVQRMTAGQVRLAA